MSVADQRVYDAIKRIRGGETVWVRMRFALVSFEDAGPNPRLLWGTGFVSVKDIYGVVAWPFMQTANTLRG